MGGVDGIAVGTVVAGGVLIWSGLRGASVLGTVQDVILGKKPSGKNAHPIAIPAGDPGTAPAVGGATGGAAAVVALALSQVGTREGPGNSQRYTQELGRGHGEAWCADFVDWVFEKTGNKGLVPQTASAPGMAQAFGARFVQGSGGIKAGDIVFYSGASNGWNGIGHVGIAVSDAGAGWKSVEGNYGDRVALNTRFSCRGYARPAYG